MSAPIVLLWHEEWGNACQKKLGFACRVVKTKLYNTGARRCEVLHSICGCNVSFSPVAAGATTRTLRLQTKLEIPSPFQFNSVGYQWPDYKIQEMQTTRIFGKGRGKGKKKKKEKKIGKKYSSSKWILQSQPPPRHFNDDLRTSFPWLRNSIKIFQTWHQNVFSFKIQ